MLKKLEPRIERINQYFFKNQELLLYFSWVISITGTLGSLFYSEILKLPPCILCWYQRILLYPLVLIYFIGLALKDKKVVFYAIPLAFIGLLIAFYHTLLYEGLIPEPPRFCEIGVSCTTQYVEVFGFLSIPALSFLAFLMIILLNFYYIFLNKMF
jgi:disulfide bond formation protein DsbB